MVAPLVIERAIEVPLIAVVADGMGGHAAGEVASRMAVERLARDAHRAVDEAGLTELLLDANAELFAAMHRQPACRGMGTTVAGIAVGPERVIAFNVGDSRVYRIDGEGLEQLSTDDTPGPKLADGRTAAMTSNLITQTLGGDYDEAEITPHLLSLPPAARERYLLCSDGLSDLLTPRRDRGRAGRRRPGLGPGPVRSSDGPRRPRQHLDRHAGAAALTPYSLTAPVRLET